MDAGDDFPAVLTDDTTEPHRLQKAILAARRYHNVPSPKVLSQTEMEDPLLITVGFKRRAETTEEQKRLRPNICNLYNRGLLWSIRADPTTQGDDDSIGKDHKVHEQRREMQMANVM